VTTDQQTTVETDIQFDPPPVGYVRVWLTWQLVHELIALDPQGKQLSEADLGTANRKAQIAFYLLGNKSPIMSPGLVWHDAWVHYKKTRFLFPSQTFVPYQKDFLSGSH
jgi:hypothetical protein